MEPNIDWRLIVQKLFGHPKPGLTTRKVAIKKVAINVDYENLLEEVPCGAESTTEKPYKQAKLEKNYYYFSPELASLLNCYSSNTFDTCRVLLKSFLRKSSRLTMVSYSFKSRKDLTEVFGEELLFSEVESFLEKNLVQNYSFKPCKTQHCLLQKPLIGSLSLQTYTPALKNSLSCVYLEAFQVSQKKTCEIQHFCVEYWFIVNL